MPRSMNISPGCPLFKDMASGSGTYCTSTSSRAHHHCGCHPFHLRCQVTGPGLPAHFELRGAQAARVPSQASTRTRTPDQTACTVLWPQDPGTTSDNTGPSNRPAGQNARSGMDTRTWHRTSLMLTMPALHPCTSASGAAHQTSRGQSRTSADGREMQGLLHGSMPTKSASNTKSNGSR